MAIQFYLTDVGRTAALNADILGLDLQIKHIAVGGGQYNAATAAPTKTALTTELERYLVNGGEIEPTTHTLRFTVNLNSTITADIYEIGLFDENNVLFAVASSTTTPLVQLINEVITIITFGFSLDDVDNITLMLDVNSPLAVTLMNQHTAHEHPHAQYKRINDDTERLKVANGTDLKDAVNKEQLDAEATARANADTNLQNTKAEKNGDNTQRFKASTALYLDEVVNKAQLDGALSATLGGLNLGNKADKNGNSGEFFNVKNGVDSSHAVNKGQLDTEATARANADTALQNSKAELAGSSAQQFSVADGSTQYHAVNKSQLDTKAPVAGNAAQEFAVATATTGSSAVNLTQLLGIVFPVGSVYISKTDNRNPNTILGVGTWVAVDGKALFGYKSGDADFGTAGGGGGSKNLSLTMTVNNRISATGSPPPSTITVTTDGVYSDYINTGDGIVSTDIDCRFKLSQEKILPPYDTFYIWERTA